MSHSPLTASRGRPRRSLVPDLTYRPAAHVVGARQDESTMLVDLRAGISYTLNELGWRIWDQMGAGTPLPMIVRTLRLEYGLPLDVLEADVMTFVDHLVERELIEAVTN